MANCRLKGHCECIGCYKVPKCVNKFGWILALPFLIDNPILPSKTYHKPNAWCAYGLINLNISSLATLIVALWATSCHSSSNLNFPFTLVQNLFYIWRDSLWQTHLYFCWQRLCKLGMMKRAIIYPTYWLNRSQEKCRYWSRRMGNYIFCKCDRFFLHCNHKWRWRKEVE